MNNKNKKGFTLVEIMIVVVIIGLLAAMAIPAFNKVREQSREKSITNNLRQIASAGQQYILEEGAVTVPFASLQPTYFPTIAAVAGEAYTAIVISEDGGVLSVSTSGNDIVRYTY